MRIAITRLIFFCLALLLSACGSSTKQSPVDLTAFAQTAGIGQVWQASAGGQMDYPVQVAAAGQQIAVANKVGGIALLNSVNGAELWRLRLDTPLSSAIGFDGQTMAVTTVANELIVIQSTVQSGKVAWRQTLKSRVFTPPLVAGGRIFVLSGDRQLQAFDAQTGSRLWQLTRPNEPLVLSQVGSLDWSMRWRF
jgi:outer membrane protein assembly factor BamB